MDGFVQVLTTASSEEEAGAIATVLLEQRLAACVQVVGPVDSRFWWDGRIERSREWLCLAKTASHRYGDVETAIREHHSYDVPEIVAVPVVAGSDDYLAWITSVLGAQTR